MKKPKYRIGDVVLYKNTFRDGLTHMVKVVSGYQHNKTWFYKVESPSNWHCSGVPECEIISLK